MFDRVSPSNRALILANVVVFGMQLLWNPIMVPLFALWPLSTGYFRPWQLLTHAFMHDGYLHILFNMFGLFMFGSQVEQLFGSARRYLIYYFVCAVGAGLFFLIVVAAGNLGPDNVAVGASGALYGLLLAFGLGYPRAEIMFFPIPVPIQARFAVIIFAALQLYLGLSTVGSSAAFGHLGGMVTGFVMIRYWQNQRRGPRR
jgi:membrane associated rhomboid family serine protease